MKITDREFIGIGITVIVIFYLSIILTIEGFINYETSRFVTYPTMLIAVTLYPLYVLMRRRGLILEEPSSRQIRYLIFVVLIVTILQTVVFLCLIL